MRKRFLLISTILVLSAFTFAACGKKSPSSPEASSEATTTEAPATEDTTEEAKTTEATTEESTVATTEEASTTEEKTEVTTASKEDEQAKPKTATGTYNGFADTNSVEIEMSDGSFKTFIVNDDDVKTALNKKGEGSKITFTYGAMEGQANMQILSVK